MRRFVLTGAPGAGKTAVLRQLEMLGFPVVEEAATDIMALSAARRIAEPHLAPDFIDAIVTLQQRRATAHADAPGGVVVHDRGPVCTLALATFLGRPVSPCLAAALQSLERDADYGREVFFIRNMGFIARTEARRIDYADALVFERIHEDTYRRLGYRLIDIAPDQLDTRVGAVVRHIRSTISRPDQDFQR